ncbi:uncharacterized protein LOC118757126 [Rhagoletis pomonella]|uniref:uncharacterized protein LOC118757126 n=1 Tax=Rhagoletis pomonella TaxID=28610 RepID=UPI001786944A|nr:uncharacterized protein LOC118757126 [Rhagoletis pomonella]
MYQCKRKRACMVEDCKKLHHSTLHDTGVTVHEPPRAKENSAQQVNTVQTRKYDHKATTILYKILPIELRGANNHIIKTFALIDEGSSCTLINKAVASQLGMSGQSTQLSLQWFGGRETKFKSMRLEVQIKGTSHKAKWHKLIARTVPSLDLPMQTVTFAELHSRYRQIKHLPIVDYTDAEPTVLIGLDNCHITASLRSIQCENSIVAVKTELGWLVYGKHSDELKPIVERVSIILHTSVKVDIQEWISDYFTTENFGVAVPAKVIESKDVVRAKRILRETIKRIGDKYECGLLWRSDEIHMPDSYNMALNRLHSIEKKMRNDFEFERAYKSAMSSFIAKGYARELTPTEAKVQTHFNWYLPHFGVFNVNKPGKLRLVFDAAAAVNRVSLNSVLLKGPDEMQPLIRVLLQFREGVVAICADIREMFLQVGMRQEDQNAQRFLWRYDINDPAGIYVMTSMIFGATCSPCIAQHVKNRNAEEVAGDRPEVIRVITDNHYVDDFVCSFRDESEALEIGQAVRETHLKAGFVLRIFISNSRDVQNRLNKSVQHSQAVVSMDAGGHVDKVLGLFWDSQVDALVFKLKLHRVDPQILTGDKCPTKREFLGLVMSVYDPLGMLADIMIYGKNLLQSLWRKGTAWDNEIPSDILGRFTSWIRRLRMVEQLRVSRCYAPEFLSPNTTVELHVFVDASEQAFAAVAFWRIIAPGSVKISFDLGKTRCAPLKLLSIPRLELQAAVLGTRLKSTIVESHTIKPSRTILWTVSRTVLMWIKSDHRQYKPFVAHRISDIMDETHENEWRWCPSKLNVADLATRAAYPMREETDLRWTRGPEFLLQPEELWPVLQGIKVEAVVDDEKRRCMLVIPAGKVINFTRFSNYLRLKRTIAWTLRFFSNVKAKYIGSVGPSGELTSAELKDAELRLCRIVQKEAFPNEIMQLKNNNTVSKDSDIYKLTPQLNHDGVLCVQGRIDYAAALSEGTRRPIILPYRHDFTELVVQWYHQRLYHQNH